MGKNSKKKEARREELRKELERYGNEILNSEEMQQAFKQRHHTLSTVGAHTMRVAATSLAICHALKKLKVETDIPAVVKGSLCHDLGILGRNEKFHSSGECSRQHPVDSVEIARQLTGELSDKTQDIIAHHMWPVGKSKPPRSLEAAIVSTADKIATFEDYAEAIRQKAAGKPWRRDGRPDRKEHTK